MIEHHSGLTERDVDSMKGISQKQTKCYQRWLRQVAAKRNYLRDVVITKAHISYRGVSSLIDRKCVFAPARFRELKEIRLTLCLRPLVVPGRLGSKDTSRCAQINSTSVTCKLSILR